MSVQAGAKLLDEHFIGWASKINTTDLNMSDGLRCILGQLYGGYSKGLNHLRLTNSEGIVLGFASNRVECVETLRAEWVREIKARAPKDSAFISLVYAFGLAHGPMPTTEWLNKITAAQLVQLCESNNITFEYHETKPSQAVRNPTI